MIIDLARFAETERPYWTELQAILQRKAADPSLRLSLEEIERFHYIYERCSADLAQLGDFSEPRLRSFLSTLVANAYCEIHESRGHEGRLPWRQWLVAPAQVFRRRASAFGLAVAITLAGTALGAVAVRADADAKRTILPFPGLMGSPKDRVALEEKTGGSHIRGATARFSAELMTHNIQVSILTLSMGLTWGIGTLIMLFYNGAVLGAVSADYLGAGQGTFLSAWLLPHGSIEIPAILFAGQAGFILAAALIGYGVRQSRAERLRAAAPDVLTIAAFCGVLLVWAGIVEAFVSQYHQPVLPYSVKITLGVVESCGLWSYLCFAGRR